MKSEKNIQQSIKKLAVESDDQIHGRILDKLLKKLDESKRQTAAEQSGISKMIVIRKASKIAAALLVVSCLTTCYVLSGKVADLKHELAQAQQNITVTEPDNSATINLYLKEHRDVVARHASFSSATPRPAQMHVNQHDILYYEFLGDGPEYMRPGIIVRGSSYQQKVSTPEVPVISNGHALSLPEAMQSAGFNLVAPSWLHPAYMLDEIRRIKGRDALQLLYTDGINSVSLFEQTLDGHRGLSARDFREYAVYRRKEQTGGTILAWRDDELSYVLVGNAEMSQLMDMAQSISAGK